MLVPVCVSVRIASPRMSPLFGRKRSTLSPIGSYPTMRAFMLAWAADIFRAAGKDPDQHASGVEEMANIAAFCQIWFRFQGVAADRHPELLPYLDTVRDASMLPVIDDMYAHVVGVVAEATVRDSGGNLAQTRVEVGSYYDRVFDKAFRDCRDEYMEGVRTGDF